MEQNRGKTRPQYDEHILPVPYGTSYYRGLAVFHRFRFIPCYLPISFFLPADNHGFCGGFNSTDSNHLGPLACSDM